MALKRWSLDELLMCVGAAVLLVIFLPVGSYITYSVSTWQEEALAERGMSLVRILARELVDPMLLRDRLGLDHALLKVANADRRVRYCYIENADGEIMAQTFTGGFPIALKELLRKSDEQIVRFRTNVGPVVDISAPMLTSELGTLHVGLSRAHAVRATRRMTWLIGLTFVGAISALLAGTRFVAARVSLPLRQLERQVSRFPQQFPAKDTQGVSGTREVESLARGFAEMGNRLDQLERERAATQKRMVHAERLAALGELAAGLAHEIHNPLDGMQECVRYLEADSEKSKRAAKYYPMLREGLERIARVMREMLTFARSGQKVSLEPCRVADVVESLELLIESHVKERKVHLTWRNPKGCMCVCDRKGLSQAALNLVLNAAEVAEGSPDPEVLIDAKCDEQWVYISVEDTGPGVAEELREQIFDPFFTTKPFGKGTGLGLSVSRQLIRAMGGEVELSSAPASLGGARFVIRLPRISSSESQNGREPG